MDRDTAITVAITTIVLTLIGGWYLRPSAPAATTEEAREHSNLSADDVRYKFQQQEEKWAKKHKGKKPPPPAADSGTPSEASDGEAPVNDDSANDDSVNDESAEEPPLE